jgi:hypothetical protein
VLASDSCCIRYCRSCSRAVHLQAVQGSACIELVPQCSMSKPNAAWHAEQLCGACKGVNLAGIV